MPEDIGNELLQKQVDNTIPEVGVSTTESAVTDPLPDNVPDVPAAPREDLVTTAAKFLQNPKVRQSPFSQRRAFLERKGLTKVEIDLAVLRSGTAADEMAVAATDGGQQPNRTNLAPPLPPPPPVSYAAGMHDPQQLVRPSAFTQLRDSASLAIFLSGAAYAAYHLYQKFVAPILSKPVVNKPDMLADVNQTIDALRRSMADVAAAINETQGLMKGQQRQLDEIIRVNSLHRGPEELDRMNVSEIKDEIRSLKALLLNRKQFPPGPSTTPIIPTWQRQSFQLQQQPLPQDKDCTVRSCDGDAAAGSVIFSSEPMDSQPKPVDNGGDQSAGCGGGGGSSDAVLAEDVVVDVLAATAVASMKLEDTSQKPIGQDGDINEVHVVSGLLDESHHENVTKVVVDIHAGAN